MDVLEHIENDFEALKSIVREASPGAIFIITVPADMRLWSGHDVRFGHYRRYDEARLRKLWSGIPLEEKLVSHFNSRLYPAVRVARVFGRVRDAIRGTPHANLHPSNGVMNRILTRIFAGEAKRLLKALDGITTGYDRGVSLIAVLERTPA
jgi:hypothetical protein